MIIKDENNTTKGFIVRKANKTSITPINIKDYPFYLDSIIIDYGLKNYNEILKIVSVRYVPVFIDKSSVQEEILDTNTYVVRTKEGGLSERFIDFFIDKKTKIIVYHHEYIDSSNNH